MAGSTGPILAAGGIVIFNAVVVHQESPMSQSRVVVGTLLAAAGLALAEKAVPTAATAFAWLVLAGVLLVRIEPGTPSPVESFANWYNK